MYLRLPHVLCRTLLVLCVGCVVYLFVLDKYLFCQHFILFFNIFSLFQLKSDGSTVSNLVSGPSGQLQVPSAEPQQVTQVIHLPVEQKISSHDLAKTGGVNMVSSQVGQS